MNARHESLLNSSEVDIERIAQALLLHVALKLPLQEKGKDCLELARKEPKFLVRIEAALARMSAPNEFGVQRMTPEQARLVRNLFVPAHV